MISGVCIILVGLPEKVQRVADALDEKLPGSVAWRDVADAGQDETITLEGVGIPMLDGGPIDLHHEAAPKLVRSITRDVPTGPARRLTSRTPPSRSPDRRT